MASTSLATFSSRCSGAKWRSKFIARGSLLARPPARPTGQEMAVHGKHGLRVVPQPRRHDVDGDALRQRERRRRVPEDVERPGREAGRFPQRAELLGEPLRVDGAAERVREDEVGVGVGVPGEVAFELLDVAVLKPTSEDPWTLVVLAAILVAAAAVGAQTMRKPLREAAPVAESR
jgi:hypothetical protein